jgi:hypothetical protein
MKKFFVVFLSIIALGALVLFLLTQETPPEKITYGVSFSKLRAEEHNLDWQETYLAILDDLDVRHFRLAAHWPMVEPAQGEYDFSVLDYQFAEAEKRDATIILSVGRRLPSWPECHIPKWTENLTEKEQSEALLNYIEAVVTRYRDSPALRVWQVENEPFLEVFAYEHCGDLDTELLDTEIALVRSLDPNHPILITDSGNLGIWLPAYKRGDLFGTSVYRYLWNPDLGPFKSMLPAWFYRAKGNLAELLYGEKEIILIELSAEPWLLIPIREASLEKQFSMMNIERFREILSFAEKTHFEKQYLWGAEWWFALKAQGHPEFWNEGKKLFTTP